MKNKLLKYSSNGCLIIGAAIGIYAFANIYILKGRLPAGLCPVTNNRPLMYGTIALCCISFILSLFETKAKKT